MDTSASKTLNRILVVDDNQDALLVLGLLLQLKGYRVETCTSGQQALQLGETYQPEVILLDISMPGMDGYETCQRIRQQVWGHSVVVIALTGYGQASDYERTQAAGFDGHLIKPVDMDVLLDFLTSLPKKGSSNAGVG